MRLAAQPKGVDILCSREDPYALALHHEHPQADERRALNLSHFARERIICLGRRQSSLCFDQAVSLCLNAGFSSGSLLEAGSFHVALGYVAARLGVALVPASTVLIAPDTVRYRKLADTSIHSSIHLVCAPGNFHPLRAQISKIVHQQFRTLGSKVVRRLSQCL